MNLSRYMARTLLFSGRKTFTRLIVRVAAIGVGVSIAVMILALAIVLGFQTEIKEKIVGFSGHITIKSLDLNQSREAKLFDQNRDFIQTIKKIPQITGVFPIASKAGILKTRNDLEGLVLKGVGPDYDSIFFKNNIKKGRWLRFNPDSERPEILVSETTSKKLKLDTGMKIDLIFIQDGQIRRRRPVIAGIFNSGLAEYDNLNAITDIKLVQRIYSLGYDSVTGFEVKLKNFEDSEMTVDKINELCDIDLIAQGAKKSNFQIFEWLSLLDTNVVVIIGLMILVAIINMITALLILIIERTEMIGILKALGTKDKVVRNIFMFQGLYLLVAGLLIGNTFGLGLGWAQKKFGFLTLDPNTYYMSEVPILFSWGDIIWINLGTLLICFLVLALPAKLVSRISPVKAIRFN